MTSNRFLGRSPIALCSLLAAMALVAVFCARPVLGFVPVEDASYDIPLPSVSHRGMNASIAAVKERTERSLNASLGGSWTVRSWNTQTGSPHSIYGSGVDLAPPFAGVDQVESTARQFITANASILRVNPGQLALEKISEGLGKYAAHFAQTYDGIEVHGGRVHATFTEGGRLFVMGSDFYTIDDLDTRPTLDAIDAERIAAGDLPIDEPDTIGGVEHAVLPGTKLIILPIPNSAEEVEYRLVHRVAVRTSDPVGVWATYVDAHDGEILWRYNEVQFYDVSGRTGGDVHAISNCNIECFEGFGYVDISVSGDVVTTSEGDGEWIIGQFTETPQTITAELSGPYCDVQNIGGEDAVFTVETSPGTPIEILFSSENAQHDERNAFDAISDAHDFLESIDPGFTYANEQIRARVSIDDHCNAYFWGSEINFYQAGDGCANTGEIQTVVQHEYGHGVQQRVINGQGGEGLGEGNSDILANLITNESRMGQGFYSCSAGVRNSDNELQYPENITGQKHADGEIIAGVMWSVKTELEQIFGEEEGRFRAAQLWHFGRVLERPFFQPDQVFSMFVADDDDGNLHNGTPSFEAICAGVRAHDTDEDGYTCPDTSPGVYFSHQEVATPQPAGTVTITGSVITTFEDASIDPGSVRLTYVIDDETPVVVNMSPTEDPDTYEFEIEGLIIPSGVDYFLSAGDDGGHIGFSPLGAPDEKWHFDLPSQFDDMEQESGWTVDLEGTDDASTGIWERVDPFPTESQPGDDHTPGDGVLAWITGQHTSGQTGANDVDDGTTTLYSPVYDLSENSTAIVKYYRWYSNGRGSDPFDDLWVVQARNNGGSWIDIERTQDDQDRWTLVSADLRALFGDAIGDVQFKFVASDFPLGSLVEAGIDDFILFLDGQVPSVPSAPFVLSEEPRFAFHGMHPNPARVGSRISFELPAPARARIDLFDVSGRRIRTLAENAYSAGAQFVEWDGLDASGAQLENGMYYIRFSSNTFSASRPLTVLR